jgi:hypothetical protein
VGAGWNTGPFEIILKELARGNPHLGGLGPYQWGFVVPGWGTTRLTESGLRERGGTAERERQESNGGKLSGMSAFGHYLLACRWRVGVCRPGTIGQGPLHV